MLVQDSLVDQPQAEGTFPVKIYSISLIVICLPFRRIFISLKKTRVSSRNVGKVFLSKLSWYSESLSSLKAI